MTVDPTIHSKTCWDAGSKLLGDAIGASLDPFGWRTESTNEGEPPSERDTVAQINVYAYDAEEGRDKDDDNDDDYYNDDVDTQYGEYSAPLNQPPTKERPKYYEFPTSVSTANTNYSTPNSEPSSARVSASLGRAVTAVILSGLAVFGICALVNLNPGNPANVRSVVNSASTYRGTINNKYKVEMNLRREGNNLSGTYVYLKYNIPIALRGTVDDANNVLLYGYDPRGKLIDIFNGTLSGNAISGTFTRQKDLKKMSFQLTRSS